MFTGLVEESAKSGSYVALERIEHHDFPSFRRMPDVSTGDSVSLDGCA